MNAMTKNLLSRVVAPVTSAALLIGMFGVGSAAAAEYVSLSSMSIGENCIGIFASPNTSVQLTWRDSSGSLKVQQTLPVDDSGTTSYCSPDSSNVIESGDRLKVSDGSAMHKLLVPELSIRLNRVTGVISGTGPVGDRITVSCPSGLFPSFEGCQWHKNITVGQSGDWSVHYPYGFLGGNFGSVSWHRGSDHVSASATAPYLEFILGRASVSGAFRPNGTATVQVRDGSTDALKATDTESGSPANGSFAGLLRDSAMNKYQVMPGDHIVSNIAGDADWIVPNIDGAASAATDMVSGRCFDAGSSAGIVQVWVYRGSKRFGPADYNTNPDGSFQFNFSEEAWDSWRPGAEIRSGDTVWIMCMQSRGDWVDLKVVAGS